MGDPRKQRRKYSGPQHPWNRARIEEEKVLVEEYGLKNKKDLWKMTSKLAKFKRQAKSLIAKQGKQAEYEKHLFLEKLQKLKLIGEGATMDDILSLSVKDLLERRLQTLLFRKGLARSVKQARQFITHGHIKINNKKITIPSYIVNNDEESKISFDEVSNLAKVDHPERVQPKKEEVKEKPKKETKEKVKKEKPKEKKRSKKNS